MLYLQKCDNKIKSNEYVNEKINCHDGRRLTHVSCMWEVCSSYPRLAIQGCNSNIYARNCV